MLKRAMLHSPVGLSHTSTTGHSVLNSDYPILKIRQKKETGRRWETIRLRRPGCKSKAWLLSESRPVLEVSSCGTVELCIKVYKVSKEDRILSLVA